MRPPLCLSAFLLTASLGTCLGLPGGNGGTGLLPSVNIQEPIPAPPATSADKGNAATASPASAQIIIPGPLRSFLRMAGISQKASPEEVLPLLAHEVRVRAYDRGRPTEFLVLVRRYLQQARELVILAGPEGTLRVSNCEAAKPLLAVLGYRLREGCGPDTALQTADPDRAFLTIDSGFPLAELEETVQGGKPFALPYPSTPVPLLFTQNDWTEQSDTKDVVDALL